MVYTLFETLVGPLLVVRDGDGLKRVAFQSGPKRMAPERHWKRDNMAFREVAEQFASYFAGELREFDLPLAPEGTAFQLAAWEALRRIPYGETRSYGQQAQSMGRPKAARAVGAANGANPLSIVVPCHRVIGSNGQLTGFGGGVDLKAKLLALERRYSGKQQTQLWLDR